MEGDGGSGSRINPETEPAARIAATLLGLEYDDMATALTSRKIYIMNEATTTYLDVAKACGARVCLVSRVSCVLWLGCEARSPSADVLACLHRLGVFVFIFGMFGCVSWVLQPLGLP